ncbi:ribonuclease H-like domain-containing protein [Chaetomium strumarium]|uniref:Ribonuclease H-like domain-containing protein n=1 Tax=Chaetomium strumarium TaxID=1170767 RepID=A0AAJ0LZ03_9PEZI|nr:ribonuclease H-like domain-containing protein [Chaetomium strumarium]
MVGKRSRAKRRIGTSGNNVVLRTVAARTDQVRGARVRRPGGAEVGPGEAEVVIMEVNGADVNGVEVTEAEVEETGRVRVRLPPRPAYGTLGKDVELWTNYVALDPKRDVVLYRYTVDITRAKESRAPKQLAAQSQKVTLSHSSNTATGGGAKKDAKTAPNKVSGMKRAYIIAQLLDESEELKAANENGGLASDYRDILITNKQLSDHSLMRVVTFRHATSDWRPEQYKVVLREPEDTAHALKMSDLLDYLGSSSPAKDFHKALYSQVLNIWLRQFSKSFQITDPSRQTVVGSTAYALNGGMTLSDGPSKVHEPKRTVGRSVDAIRGYFSSIRFGAAKAWINVNVTYGTFFEPILLDKWVKKAGLDDKLATLHATLKGLRVRLKHRKVAVDGAEKDIIKVISGLASKQDGKGEKGDQKAQKAPDQGPQFLNDAPDTGATCRQVMFYDKGKKEHVSVYDHFCKAYPHRKISPNELVINVGSQLRPSYYPISVCEILEGQNFRSKLFGDQTAKMIALAQLKPIHSAKVITRDGFQVIGIGSQPGESAPLFPSRPHTEVLGPSRTLAPTRGRKLDAPRVLYSNKQSPTMESGWWVLGEKGFLKSGKSARWAMLPIDRFLAEEWKKLIKQIDGDMTRRGFAQDARKTQREFQNVLTKKFRELREAGYNFLFVLLPGKDIDRYNMVKTAGDIEVGIDTVCLVQKNALNDRRMHKRDQYWDNILLKANLKLGGVNHTVECDAAETILSQRRAMVVGYDVTHAVPGAGGTSSSIIGIVANVDSNLAQWPATVAFQTEENKEIVNAIKCFQQLLGPHLERWAKFNARKNKTKYPEALIIYRDGVSEGQYNHVIEQESTLIPSSPKITIVIVGKRHHTRFYPKNEQAADEKGNPKPGTIVDRSITSQFLWEFYLQAHEAIQGTARPTHYVVVVDEFFGANFGQEQDKLKIAQPYRNAADVLEDFTHTLSYCLGRATRSTAVCVPAKLADKVCDRARVYIAAGIPADNEHLKIADTLKDTMFYI